MNRQIKFRGKSKWHPIGEWKYGFLQWRQWDNAYYIDNGLFGSKIFAVDPETIGQFTGLYDKEGKEIWEGDIVQWILENEHEIHDDGVDVVFYEQACFNLDQYPLMAFASEDLEVIGNEFDNPELLKQ